jgi:hypothetical protein
VGVAHTASGVRSLRPNNIPGWLYISVAHYTARGHTARCCVAD